MSDILPLLECLVPEINMTTMRQLNRIIMAMLAMSGRVTMLGISRWTNKGGSYRTVCRFFHTVIPWTGVMWLFFQRHLWCQKDTYILAGDEVVVSKSGEETYGIDRFYSSLFNKPILGISFLALSFISVEKRHSFPIKIEQIIKPEKKEDNTEKSTEVTPQQKKKKGRPKGSKNRDKTQVVLTPELLLIKDMINSLFKLLKGLMPLTYFVVDGHYGNNNALQMVRQVNLHIISKLRYNSALYIPFKPSEPNQKKGNKKYGDKINYRDIPKEYLRSSTLDEDKNIKTDIYQATLLPKEFAQELNVVILVKTNLITLASAHVILFSSDLELSIEKIVDYYQLRFQIEFNFRDAKQFWGLEDFMNQSQTAVTNAANLAFFLVNLSHYLLAQFRPQNPNSGIIDLKAYYHGCQYVRAFLKMLPEKPEPILLSQIFAKLTSIGRIHKGSTNPLPS